MHFIIIKSLKFFLKIPYIQVTNIQYCNIVFSIISGTCFKILDYRVPHLLKSLVGELHIYFSVPTGIVRLH